MSSKPERETNFFAAELLIPDENIIEYEKQISTYEHIAAKLAVPIELVDFKSHILRSKGYKMASFGQTKGDF